MEVIVLRIWSITLSNSYYYFFHLLIIKLLAIMSQTTFWQNSFLSVDVCQQAIWFSVLHILYSVGKFWSVTCLYLEYINTSQWNYKVKTMQDLFINALTVSLIYNFLETKNKIQHEKYSDILRSEAKSPTSSMAVPTVGCVFCPLLKGKAIPLFLLPWVVCESRKWYNSGINVLVGLRSSDTFWVNYTNECH